MADEINQLIRHMGRHRREGELKDEAAAKQASMGEMHKRRTTLEDGRYLIYYTFGNEGGEPPAEDEAAPKREHDAESVAEKERHV